MKELATPEGIDHDYNFISSIERGIERSDKLIVQEKGLVNVKELFKGPERWPGRYHGGSGSEMLAKAIYRSEVRVDKAPKGMKRQTENGTKWNKTSKCIEWQVEWQRGNDNRTLERSLESMRIGEAYKGLILAESRASMTAGERKQDNKRKAEDREFQRTEAKRMRLSGNSQVLTQKAAFQNFESSAWNLVSPSAVELADDIDPGDAPEEADINTFAINPSEYDSWQPSSNAYFYLLRTYTPSSYGRVLTPLHPDWTLKTVLRNRVVLEFPTIYVLPMAPNSLPEGFMLESHFFAAQKRGPVRDDSDEDTDMEEGEIA